MTSLTLCLHKAALHKNNNELQLRPEGQKRIIWEGKKKKRKGKEKKNKNMMTRKLFFPLMQHMNICQESREDSFRTVIVLSDNGATVDSETNDVIKAAGEKFEMAHQIF